VTATSELRGLADSELDQRLQEAYQELLNLRFRKATKQLDNTARIRVVRHNIARIKTIMRERELESEGEVPGA
jgi:large subunit ribosomal protein L29